jgi:UDP-N-acetyl-D-glucosamine dehydrogenase
VGGHSIAIDPTYLSWLARQRTRFQLSLVELAEINAQMPAYVASRIAEGLNERGKPLKGAKILGIGVAY